MPNGKNVIEEIREIIKSPDCRIPARTRDRLILAAISQLYEMIEPVYISYRVAVVIGGVLSTLLVVFFGALLTGKVSITFR